ncbi:unnamed protein product [Leptosia nina]|uniref:Gag-like protein n=1 Tax=Leptosia nina TaxID=320188 RepID=A0AAV1JXY8_9NEOP
MEPDRPRPPLPQREVRSRPRDRASTPLSASAVTSEPCRDDEHSARGDFSTDVCADDSGRALHDAAPAESTQTSKLSASTASSSYDESSMTTTAESADSLTSSPTAPPLRSPSLLEMLSAEQQPCPALSPKAEHNSDTVSAALVASCGAFSPFIQGAIRSALEERERALKQRGILDESAVITAEEENRAYEALQRLVPLRRPRSSTDDEAAGREAKRLCAMPAHAARDPRLQRRAATTEAAADAAAALPVAAPPAAAPPVAAPPGAALSAVAVAPPGAALSAVAVAPPAATQSAAVVAPSIATYAGAAAAVAAAPTVQARPPRAPAAQPAAAKPRYPPIVVEYLPDWVHHLGEIRRLLGRTANTRSYGRGHRITPETEEEYRVVQRYLSDLQQRDQRVTWFSYSIPAERELKVAIRGIPVGTDPEAIKEALRGLNYEPEHIQPIRASKGRPGCLYLAILRRTPGITPGIYAVNELMFMTGVTIEAWRGKRGPAQCHRCQQFRHSSHNCHRPIACVRCGEPHRAADCPRPKAEPATCANCRGPHPANHSTCPVRKTEARNKRAGTVARTGQSRPTTRAATTTQTASRRAQSAPRRARSAPRPAQSAAPAVATAAPAAAATSRPVGGRKGGKGRYKKVSLAAAEAASRRGTADSSGAATTATTAAATPTTGAATCAAEPCAASCTEPRAAQPDFNRAIAAILQILQAMQAGSDPAPLFERAARDLRNSSAPARDPRR